jgi:predicted nuclease with TOPRIM domain
MGIEQLTYLDLAERLNISAEAARSLVRRMHLPRQKANDGKTLVAVDMGDIRHKPAAMVRRVDLDALQARVNELEELLRRAEAIAARQRADYERERERAERLAGEILRMVAEVMAAKEKAARLEGELAALRARPWWLRLSSYRPWNPQYAVGDAR